MTKGFYRSSYYHEQLAMSSCKTWEIMSNLAQNWSQEGIRKQTYMYPLTLTWHWLTATPGNAAFFALPACLSHGSPQIPQMEDHKCLRRRRLSSMKRDSDFSFSWFHRNQNSLQSYQKKTAWNSWSGIYSRHRLAVGLGLDVYVEKISQVWIL